MEYGLEEADWGEVMCDSPRDEGSERRRTKPQRERAPPAEPFLVGNPEDLALVDGCDDDQMGRGEAVSGFIWVYAAEDEHRPKSSSPHQQPVPHLPRKLASQPLGCRPTNVSAVL